MASQNTYQTKDFYLSAFLLLKGITLISIDKTEPGRAVFIFEFKNVGSLVKEFWNGNSQVIAKDYSFKIKELKSRLYTNDVQDNS